MSATDTSISTVYVPAAQLVRLGMLAGVTIAIASSVVPYGIVTLQVPDVAPDSRISLSQSSEPGPASLDYTYVIGIYPNSQGPKALS